VTGKNARSGSISRQRPQFADRRSRIARAGLLNFTPVILNAQNSNRECFRLEIDVTRRKQTRVRADDSTRRNNDPKSNRENNEVFQGPLPASENGRRAPGGNQILIANPNY